MVSGKWSREWEVEVARRVAINTIPENSGVASKNRI
jgi:hypothetical protein